jgi:hypothetical protein
MNDRNDNEQKPAPQRAVIKRRWAILPGAGTAVVAVAAAIALGDPADQTDQAHDPTGGDSQISAEA